MRRRRQRALETPFPERWRATLEQRMATWPLLGGDERSRLEDLIRIFLAETSVEPAAGFSLTEEMAVTVAGQACLLILELGPDYYRDVSTVIVHPSSSLRRGERHVGGGVMTDTPILLSGEARFHGPVAVSWSDAVRAADHPATGHNVVFHEFAHKIDMLDGTIDGTPPLPAGRLRDRFVAVCESEYLLVRDGFGESFLDAYAGTNPGEFFAVATEVFFDLPAPMEVGRPDLYEVLASFYRQDPAARTRR